jgi:hypothetical protein
LINDFDLIPLIERAHLDLSVFFGNFKTTIRDEAERVSVRWIAR